MKKRVLFISGGGTKIVFLASVAIQLMKVKKIRFHHIVGVSAGSLLSLLLAMNEFTLIKENVLRSSTRDIFKHHPKSILGIVLTIWNVVTGKIHLYNDESLGLKIKSLITEDKFNRYKSDPTTAKCYVICVDVNNGEELVIDLKNESYNDAINYVLASASIPVFVDKKVIKGRNLFDGGLRSHIGASVWLRSNVKQINECYSIYSRPSDLNNITWKLPKVSEVKKKVLIGGLIYGCLIGPLLSSFNFGIVFNVGIIYLNIIIAISLIVNGLQINIISMIQRSVEILNLEVSKSDEREADNLCYKHLKRNQKIFAPYKLLDGPYENSEEDNLRMWNLGIESVEENPELWRKL